VDGGRTGGHGDLGQPTPYSQTVSAFDVAVTFGDDYLHFTGRELTEDVNNADAAEIVEFLAPAPGARLLDAPCGEGRITSRLAGSGLEVVGVDASPTFVDRARRAATAEGIAADYVVGDLRRLPLRGPFDAVICWFTSFGYFDDEENRQVLAEFHRLLRPGGRLLVETLHHDGVVRHFTAAPDATVLEVGDDLQIDRHTFDPHLGRVETERTTVRGGLVRRSRHFVRLPTVPEWRAWLEAAGFATVRVSDRGGQPLTLDSWRIVVQADA
jgi:SAM-dependent methyltransferase